MKRSNKLIRFLTTLVTCGILTSLSALPVMAYTGSETDTSEESTIIREENTEETGNDDSNAFSVEGNGTLTDEADSSQNKLFYIVTTANGNSYYIIIDKDSTTNNVYMLSQIDEADLADFTEETDPKNEESVTTDSPDANAESATDQTGEEVTEPAKETDTETSSPGAETETADSGSSAGKYIGYVLLALACIGVIAGYYFLKVRNRDDQEEEDETAYGDDEQPDDIYDPEAEEADEEEEPEDDEEDNNDTLSDDPQNTPEEGNVPFVDYPDPEDDPEEDNKDEI